MKILTSLTIRFTLLLSRTLRGKTSQRLQTNSENKSNSLFKTKFIHIVLTHGNDHEENFKI